MTTPETEGTRTGSSSRVRALRAVGLVVLVAALAWSVRTQWGKVGDDLAGLDAVDAVLALVLSAAAVVAAFLAWRAMLADLGSELRLVPAAHIFSVSQVGKYLPGSVWPVLTQMELGRSFRVPRLRMATAFLLTLLSGLVVAVAVAGLLTFSSPGWGRAFALLPLCLVVLHPRLLMPVSQSVTRVLRRPAVVQPPSAGGVARTIAWLLVQWLCLGAASAALAHGVGADVDVARVVGAASLSWAVGLMVVVVPAGAGVREGLFTVLLAGSMGSAHALAVALLGRLALTIADAAFAVYGVMVARRAARDHAEAGPPESA